MSGCPMHGKAFTYGCPGCEVRKGLLAALLELRKERRRDCGEECG